jgi:hypothetical protein
MAGWEFARPDSDLVLAFVYAATVGLRVEDRCVGINPALPLEELARILTPRPNWIGKRLNWLKTEWPSQPVLGRGDLELYALTASKTLLAAGSPIPDGTSVEMASALSALFPQVTIALQQDAMSYEAWKAQATIDSNGQMGWGYGGPVVRKGRRLPLPDASMGDRGAFEVFLQNQMRIDIQRRLEAYL